MSFRNIAAFVFLFLLFGGIYGCSNIEKNKVLSNPNIVIIYLDDLGYGDLSAYGATEIITLNIDALANGSVLNDGYYDGAVEKLRNHKPAGPYRGGKYSLYEGGTRVPFISYWKGKISPLVSDAIISQVDLLTSISKLINNNSALGDGEELLDVLLGKSTEGRDQVVLEAKGRKAFRKGDWLYIPINKGVPINTKVNIETGYSKIPQLYNLREDISQSDNLYEKYPVKVEEMNFDLNKILETFTR